MAILPTEPATTIYSFSDQPGDPAWDTFLATLPDSHHEQLSGWAEVKSAYGWQTLRLLAKQNDAIIGGLQVLTKRAGCLGTIGYVSRGPLVMAGHSHVEDSLVGHLDNFAAKEGWLYLVYNYPYTSERLANGMLQHGYSPHPAGLPPSGLLTATCMVDLQASEEQILARMNQSVRRNIRRAKRSPLQFTEGHVSDLATFRELMLATCVRRGTAPTPPQPDFFHRLWTQLAPQGWVMLFFITCGSEPVSAAFCFTLGNTVRVWKTGWSGQHADMDPNHLLWWEIIRWAKARGFRRLDFVWVDTEDARRAAAGEKSPEGFRDGTTYFKLGFGGDLLFPPAVQSRFFQPWLRTVFKLGGRQIVSSRVFQGIVSRYRQTPSD